MVGVEFDLGQLSRVLEVCFLDVFHEGRVLYKSEIKQRIHPHGAWYDTIAKDLGEYRYIDYATLTLDSHENTSENIFCHIRPEGKAIIDGMIAGELKAIDTKLGSLAADREKRILEVLCKKSPLWSRDISDLLDIDLIAMAFNHLVHTHRIGIVHDDIVNPLYEITDEGRESLTTCQTT